MTEIRKSRTRMRVGTIQNFQILLFSHAESSPSQLCERPRHVKQKKPWPGSYGDPPADGWMGKGKEDITQQDWPVQLCRLDVHQVERFTAGEQQKVSLKSQSRPPLKSPAHGIWALIQEFLPNYFISVDSLWQTGCFPVWWCLPPGRPSISRSVVWGPESQLMSGWH